MLRVEMQFINGQIHNSLRECRSFMIGSDRERRGGEDASRNLPKMVKIDCNHFPCIIHLKAINYGWK